jgi:hypothetical protein
LILGREEHRVAHAALTSGSFGCERADRVDQLFAERLILGDDHEPAGDVERHSALDPRLQHGVSRVLHLDCEQAEPADDAGGGERAGDPRVVVARVTDHRRKIGRAQHLAFVERGTNRRSHHEPLLGLFAARLRVAFLAAGAGGTAAAGGGYRVGGAAGPAVAADTSKLDSLTPRSPSRPCPSSVDAS